MKNISIDVVFCTAYGDSSKGKICHTLSQSGEYTHALRYSGGGNAGHTIYHKGTKIVTHQIPTGIVNGVKSIIGPGCVVNPFKLEEEIYELESHGIQVQGKLFIAKNAHIVTQDHVEEDSKDKTIGTTKTGNGPAYRDKYSRIGVRVEDFNILKPMLIDMYEEFYSDGDENLVVLAEGAQGFYLDIDWGDYPYVTSSHCNVGGVLLNGFAPKHIRNVYGSAKAYVTYVGNKKFQPDDEIFKEIQIAGNEFGATTGRSRQCNWLDLDQMIKATRMNDVNMLIIAKIDILDKLKVWKLYDKGNLLSFDSSEEFRNYITKTVQKQHKCLVKFSDNPYTI